MAWPHRSCGVTDLVDGATTHLFPSIEADPTAVVPSPSSGDHSGGWCGWPPQRYSADENSSAINSGA
jgi:hypothetical protein